MSGCALEICGNPASVHWYGRQARERIEQHRAEFASWFGAHPRDVLFVSGGTEANNLALLDASALITSQLEHPSVTRVAHALERQRRPVRWLDVQPSGRIDLDSLERALAEMPPGTVVALQAVNHETGVIQPLAEAAELTHRASGWLHVDAVQALGKLDPMEFLVGDSFAIAAHKIRGPKGIGALIWHCGRTPPHPMMFGGSQQRGLRPGTLDPVGVVGFAAAMSRVNASPVDWRRVGQLRDRLEGELSDLAASNCGTAPRVAQVASLRFAGWNGDELVAALDVEGLCVSSGSACSAGTAEPSPVVVAMRGVECARETIRISLGETTTDAEISRACDIIRGVVARIPHIDQPSVAR